MLIFAEEQQQMMLDLEKQSNLTAWMKRIDIIPEVAATERKFRNNATELLENGLSGPVDKH